MWFSEYWNINDFIAILIFFTGVGLRCYTGSVHIAGRLLYCLDIIFWFVRLLDLLAINQQAGPYLTMISNMMRNMFYIVLIMGIVLLSYGTPRWSILKPDEEPSWDLLKQVLFQPYFMMFGEVYAGEINPCEGNPDCPPGSFLNPLLQAVYLFMQYIIMVNLLIAFYNNVYIHMKTISNKLWLYNRYRYIMTYHNKPWLPPPLILLSHGVLCASAVWRTGRGASPQESDSGLKLFLDPDDLKTLHEFEERCVAGYFRDKLQRQSCSQLNRIRQAADKTGEMMDTMSEVSEKVQFIQESLQRLDAHLGRLQDLSALAVDTLNLLSASDNRQQEAVLLGHSVPLTSRYKQLSHSWSLRRGGTATPSYAPPSPKAYCSTPPSLLQGLGKTQAERLQRDAGGICDSRLKCVLGYLEVDGGARQRLGGESSVRLSHGSLSPFWSELHVSPTPSRTSSLTTVWAHDPHRRPSQEDSVEEEEEEEDDVFSDPQVDRGGSMGIVNPTFCGDSERATPRKGQFYKKLPFDVERKMRQSRSLSASVETMATPTARHSNAEKDTSPPMGERKKVTELSRTLERKRSFGRKCVKIKEGDATDIRRIDRNGHMRESIRRLRHKGRGLAGRKVRSSVSLSQLTVDHVDILHKSLTLGQITRSPSQSVWSSWARSVSRRSSVQSWVGSESRGPLFQTTDDLDPHYSAMERNNLMRLAHTIPFTPVSLLGGEEVYVYTLEESDPDSMFSSTSYWCQRGHAAVLQPLSEQEGALDGGLRRAQRVLCTWAEGDVLKPGSVYVVKAFSDEVLRSWQTEFPDSTTLHLCLREIQQQRAAQKLMQVFNQLKPSSVPHTLRVLDVSLLYWQAEGQWLTIERNMSGDFMKYNSNTGEEIVPSCGLEETVLAFSHWTYEYTSKELLVLDLKGVGAELTDPSVIRAEDKSSSGDLVFGPANLGDAAIQSFILNHSCNLCCESLGLSDLRNSNSLQKSSSACEEHVSIF